MTSLEKIAPLLLGGMMMAGSVAAAETGTIPARHEISADLQWKLTDIYPGDAAWQADLEKLQRQVAEIRTFQGTLAQSPGRLFDCLALRDHIGMTSEKLYAYARMNRDTDANSSVYQSMTGRMESILAEAGAASAFIEPEILAISPKKLIAFQSEDSRLTPYRYYFLQLDRQRRHVLSPQEEALLSRAADVNRASETIFSMLSQADMKFPATLSENGGTVELSEGRYGLLIRSADRAVRKAAFQNLFGTYQKFRNTYAATLNGTLRKNSFYAKVRNYPGPLEAALAADNISPDVYNNVITTVNHHLPHLHRYIALRKEMMGLDTIHMYDLYTSLVPETNRTWSYAESQRLLLSALQPLGPQYTSSLAEGFSSGWIDVYENRGKRSGAYSWGVYGVHPFVLLNFHGRYDDVSTLAHEMGHALHSHNSNARQHYATSSYSIFTAEVASTTNEILLLEYMLAITTNPQDRMFYINQYLDQIRGTVYTQAMFADFERRIALEAEKGETLTPDLLDNIWSECLQTYLGPGLSFDPEMRSGWARIPHFYRNFYVYQYVTGYTAANTLAARILQQVPGAQAAYISFLQSGGSDDPIRLLQTAGVDMTSPLPLEITLTKFATLVDELERLHRQASIAK